MKKLWIFFSIILCLVMTVPGYAADTDVMTIIDKMKGVHNSAFGMAQKMDIHIKVGDKMVTKWVAGLAQKQLPTGRHVLMVVLEPDMLKGFSYLYKEKNDLTVDHWIYSPAIRRIRRLVSPCNAYDAFLHTDFTYADLGFVDTKGDYKLLGEEKIEDTLTYKVEKVPDCQNYYYSRIITWISKETYLPLRRDYYDIADRLYKRQLFEDVFMVAGTPVPYKVTMNNLQSNSSTILSIKELKTGWDLPDDLFSPERLFYSTNCPIWERLCYPSEKVREK